MHTKLSFSYQRRYAPHVTREIGWIVGDNVRRLRRAASPVITQEELAQVSGLSRATIAALERHRYPSVTLETVTSLARGLGVVIDELLLDVETGSLTGAIKEFLRSPWHDALQPTDEELRWLRHLPSARWLGARVDAESIADLLKWRRQHPNVKP